MFVIYTVFNQSVGFDRGTITDKAEVIRITTTGNRLLKCDYVTANLLS